MAVATAATREVTAVVMVGVEAAVTVVVVEAAAVAFRESLPQECP